MNNLKKYNNDLQQWKEQNAIPEDAEEPGEETPKQPDEDMMDYVLRIAKHRIEKAKWQTAPKLEDYINLKDCVNELERKCKVNKLMGWTIITSLGVFLIFIISVFFLKCSPTKKEERCSLQYNEAIQEGKKSFIVYVCTGGSSKKFHWVQDCRWLENCKGEIIPLTIDEAEQMNKTPCKTCCK